MLWLIPALAAPLLWATSNLIDSRLVNRDMKSVTALVMFSGPFMLVPLIYIVATGQFAWPGATVAIAALVAGALGEYTLLPYFKALTLAATSDVILMWNLSPIFTAIAARWAVHEQLLPAEYLAIALLVASSLMAAYEGTRRLRLNSSIAWMLLATLIYSAAVVTEKFVYERVPFGVGYGWVALGAVASAIFLAIISPGGRAVLKKYLRGRTAAVMAGNEGLDLAAGISASLATSLGAVSLVRAVGGIQPLFVLVIAFFFPSIDPRHVRETAHRRWLRTTLSVALAIAGLLLIKTE